MFHEVFDLMLCACALILLTSCFKLQINPEGAIEDTVSAATSLYKTIKRKKDGTEERPYTIELAPDADEQQIGNECLEFFNESVNSATEKDPQIREADTEIVTADSGNKLMCSILVGV